jgi:hypothetical protein
MTVLTIPGKHSRSCLPFQHNRFTQGSVVLVTRHVSMRLRALIAVHYLDFDLIGRASKRVGRTL